MKKSMKKILAFMLALVLVLENLGGIGTPVVKAAGTEVNNRVLNVKTVDGEGNAVPGVQLMMESGYGSDYNVDLGSTDTEGKLSYPLGYQFEDYNLQTVGNSGYSCEPVEIYVGENDEFESVIETVNGEEYTGEVTLVVQAEEVVPEAKITSVAFAEGVSVDKNGGSVTVKVTGENLPDKLYYSRQYMAADAYGTSSTTVDGDGVEVTAVGSATEKTISVPLESVTTYPKALAWKVRVGLSDDLYNSVYVSTGELAIDGVEAPKTPEIKSVTTSKASVSAAGEEITITVAGTALPNEVYYKLYYQYDFNGTLTDSSFGMSGAGTLLGDSEEEKTFAVVIPAESEVDGGTTGWKVAVSLSKNGTYVKSEAMSIEELTGIQINETNFPDEEFRRYVSENFDTNEDNSLQQEEIDAATSIDFYWGEYWVADLKGIEYFTNLESLNCSFVALTEIDLSANVNLTYLDCSYNEELTTVNVTENVKLEELHCYETPIETLDVTKNTELVRLDCNNTKISTIDVSNCTKLFALNVENTKLTSIDISKNPEMYETYISFTDIAEFDISNNPEMGQIRFEETKVTSMDFSKNPELAAVRCANTPIKKLDFANNPAMYEIFCFGTEIETLDLTNMPGLHTVECHDTKLTKLDVTKNPGLVGLTCGNTGITELNVTNNPELKRLECDNTKIKHLDLSKNLKLETLNVSNTAIAEMKSFDAGYLTALEELYCNNAGMEKLNLASNAELYSLDCGKNAITELDLSGVGELWYLKTISPQNVAAEVLAKDGKMVVDMKDFVSDLSKVVIPESDNYTYDAKTGLVTFNKAGEAKFAYTYDHGYLYGLDPMTVEVSVSGKAVPKAPAGASAVLSGGHDDVKFSWGKVAGADGYFVYFKKATDKAWSSAINVTTTSYLKKDLADNVTYNFKVVPYVVIKGQKSFDVNQYKVANVATKKNIKATRSVKVVLSGGHDDVKVTWKKVKGASGYYVYMKKAADARYKKIATTKKLTLKKKNLADGVKYTFKVVPYYKNGKSKVAGYYEKSTSVYTLKKLAAPTIVKVSSKKVKVSWTNIEGESGYQISRSTKKKGTKIVSTYSTKSGKAKTLKVSKNKKYYYKVRAYKTVGGKKIYGPWSKVKAYKLK